MPFFLSPPAALPAALTVGPPHVRAGRRDRRDADHRDDAEQRTGVGLAHALIAEDLAPVAELHVRLGGLRAEAERHRPGEPAAGQ
jgi:hypothetical protein